MSAKHRGKRGKRGNAGRNAQVKRPHAVQVMLSDAELEWLNALAHHYKLSRAAILREALSWYGVDRGE